jgi:hypothetical protein
MQVDYAFICDFAEAREKVNALGIGFDTIFAPQVPAKHPHFNLVVQLRVSVAEVGTKDVTIHLINVDGVDVIPPVNGKLEVKRPAQGIVDSTVRLNMEFGNVEFKEYGSYSVRVTVAGQEVVSIPLRVVQPPKTA